MFSLNETNNFMVYSTSVDLRKGVELLCGLARSLGRGIKAESRGQVFDTGLDQRPVPLIN